MTGFKRCIMWYYMFCKRLARKFSFVALLCLIPIIVMLANKTMSEESGVLRIVVCSEDNNAVSAKIIDSLLAEESIISFTRAKTADEAREMVRRNEADAAWIFESDFDKKVELYTSKKSKKPFIKVVEREESIPLQLSKMRLYGAVYEELSYSLYKNFTYENVVRKEDFSETEMRKVYDMTEDLDNVVEIYRLDSEETAVKENYLTVPLRGFLSLVVMLCTMAAVMYFLKDKNEGRYDWMPAKKRLAPAFASCFSAATISAFAVWITLVVSGTSNGAIKELLSLMLFAASATGFCLILCVTFRSEAKVGAIIPALIIVMLVLSPIFFNLKVLTPVKMLIPTHYYLHSTYDNDYYLYTLSYCAIMYLAAFLLNTILNKK